jgi:hypothetical protein
MLGLFEGEASLFAGFLEDGADLCVAARRSGGAVLVLHGAY